METRKTTETRVRWWPGAGPEWTEATLDLAVERAAELGLETLVVASNTGATARALRARLRPGMRAVCVTHQVGLHRPGEDEMDPETRRELRASGVEVLTTTHFLGGIDRALRIKHGGLYPAEIVAATLRMFGQGTKVAVEIAVMATDAGLVPPGRELVGVGGTGRGADTALVIRPAHGQAFFDLRIVEIICAPRG